MRKIFLLITSLIFQQFSAQNLEVIPLGVYGGIDESNLSSYLVGVKKNNSYLALDAGTLTSGIKRAIALDSFDTITDSQLILKNYIKGYFISHGHLDHVSGLIINSPEDSSKPIYGLTSTLDILKEKYFVNGSWSNFANEGEEPILGKYKYRKITPLQFFPVENTALIAEIFELSHVNPQKSSAILIKYRDEYILYFGDTGADRIEKTNNLDIIWKHITPLVINKNLQAILIEVSFPNQQPEEKLFGHLTPSLLNEEFTKLADYVGKENLEGLNVIITHLKPSSNQMEIIKQELLTNNIFNLNYIFPEQGKKISFE
jgi:cAMP phosphodiesterase